MEKEKNISLIKTENKNTYPKNLILYFAIFYEFINKAIKISSMIVLTVSILGFFDKFNNLYNLIYGFSFNCLVICFLVNNEIKKALNNNNYKELSFENKENHKYIMILSYIFTISFVLFLQLTIIELLLGQNYLRFLLIIPYLYLYFMFEKGINYQKILVKINKLNISRNYFLILTTPLIMVNIIKFIMKQNVNLNKLYFISCLFSCVIVCLFYMFVKSKTFYSGNTNKKNFVLPIRNYFNEELFIRKNTKKPQIQNKVQYYLEKSKQVKEKQKLQKKENDEIFKVQSIYKEKQKIKEKDRRELEYIYKLRKQEDEEEDYNLNYSLIHQQNTQKKSQNSLSSENNKSTTINTNTNIKKNTENKDCCLDRTNIRKRR